MDVTIKSNENYSYDFAVCFKVAVTNVQIKPHPNISPHITMGVSKVFSLSTLIIGLKKKWIKTLNF